MLRPLPFPDADRLVTVWEKEPHYSRMELSPANYRDWKAQSKSFEAFGAYSNLSVNLAGEGEPERLLGEAMTADVLPPIGVKPRRSSRRGEGVRRRSGKKSCSTVSHAP